MFVFGICACLMDGYTTFLGLQQGHEEHNPVVAQLITSLGLVGGIGVAVGMRCAVFALCAYEMQQPRWKRWQIAGFGVLGFVCAAATWLVVLGNIAVLSG
jgi:hypothetical protein